jgi:hypothetical protein
MEELRLGPSLCESRLCGGLFYVYVQEAKSKTGPLNLLLMQMGCLGFDRVETTERITKQQEKKGLEVTE